MFYFILLTFIAYISIDFSVYWLGTKEVTHFSEIVFHHAKMLPVYLVANIFLTFGFVYGLGKELNPMLLMALSIVIWAISLMIVGSILYKVYPNFYTVIGLIVIVVGALLVNFGIKQ